MGNNHYKIVDFFKKHYGYTISFVFLISVCIYICIKKDNIYIQIWDNLDSNIAWLKMLKDNKAIFTSSIEIPFLGGINRDYLYSQFSFYTVLYYIFPVYYAFVIGWFLKVIISIVGMNLLCQEITKNDKYRNIFIISGLIYGLTATFPTAAFGFATLPIVFYLLIKIYNKPSTKYLIYLLIYPIFSDLFTFGVFIIGYIFIFFVIDFIKNKKPKWILLLSMLTLLIGYILVNYKLLYLLLFSSSNTIKNDGAQLEYNYSIFKLLVSTIKVMINGIDHASASQKYFILPFSILYEVYLIIKSIYNRNIKNLLLDPIVYILILICFNCFVYSLDSFGPFKNLISCTIPFLGEFSFARTVWLNPFLWCLLLALILAKINTKKISTIICCISLFTVIMSNDRYNVVGTNIRKVIGLSTPKGTETTYNDYYSEELFKKIKRDIHYNDEWCVAFGMHPAVIEYNGFHTLDGYLSYYSADYKNKFRKIIEPELEIDEEHRDYYDSWGGRAYIFSMETSYNTWKNEYQNEKANIYIDIDAFRSLKGKYVLSRVEIANYKEIGFRFVKKYSDDNSSYSIYLYES